MSVVIQKLCNCGIHALAFVCAVTGDDVGAGQTSTSRFMFAGPNMPPDARWQASQRCHATIDTDVHKPCCGLYKT